MNRLLYWLASFYLLCRSKTIDLGCAASAHKPPRRSVVRASATTIENDKGSPFGSTDYKDVLDISPENNFIRSADGSQHDLTSPRSSLIPPIASNSKDVNVGISPDNQSVAGRSRHDNLSATLIPRVTSTDFDDVLDISAEHKLIHSVVNDSRLDDSSPSVIPPIAPARFNDVIDISAENNFIQSFADVPRHDNPLPPSIPCRPPSPPWHHRLAASFSAMAEQMKTFSQALEHLSVDAQPHNNSESFALQSRVEALERRHERLSGELGALKIQFSSLGASPRLSNDGLETKIDDLATSFRVE
jgi:hypothetical protein